MVLSRAISPVTTARHEEPTIKEQQKDIGAEQENGIDSAPLAVR